MRENLSFGSEEKNVFLDMLFSRFEKNRERHPDLVWEKIKAKLMVEEGKLFSLFEMERTGGEPDVIGYDEAKAEYIFCDCSRETPIGRRGLAYDKGGLESRREHRPQGSALEMAQKMGVELLTEEEYRFLQTLGPFDTKTSSWLKTPPEVRKLGGALFGEFRYGRVFVYHNGASAYYQVRGFRALLRV